MKFLGTTNDVTTCECCGKSNLQKTVVLSDDFGSVIYYGSDCAGKTLYGKKNASNTKQVIRQAKVVDYAKVMIEKWGSEKTIVAIWNKFGYSSQIVDNKLKISDFALIPL